jgi:hypothetical protein
MRPQFFLKIPLFASRSYNSRELQSPYQASDNMESIDPEFVKQFIWLIAKGVISVCLGLVVFRISHERVLSFVCFAAFWVVVLARPWR